MLNLTTQELKYNLEALQKNVSLWKENAASHIMEGNTIRASRLLDELIKANVKIKLYDETLKLQELGIEYMNTRLASVLHEVRDGALCTHSMSYHSYQEYIAKVNFLDEIE